ncbi:MAG TPA: CDP-diacylglycerol--glycerol-3-phosphate 3-phosphatidyltransferase [Stellaceae bacterium]|jgi:cardiolipin synthase|nr:CDP-diacylglycerol--glycerol-3-phosphate 3-phosphatidyltransferase [Stellaceae bacterium]
MLNTLPNLLTLSRIVAMPLVVATFYIDAPLGPWLGCALFALAGFTDWLDGKLARAWEQQSEWGKFLDPIADKVLVAATLLMLTATQRISGWSVLPALVILSREILVSGLREHLAGIRVKVPVSNLAKWKTAVQMVAIGVLLVGDSGPGFLQAKLLGEALLWIAAAFTLITGYQYFRAGIVHVNVEEDRRQKQAQAQKTESLKAGAMNAKTSEQVS